MVQLFSYRKEYCLFPQIVLIYLCSEEVTRFMEGKDQLLELRLQNLHRIKDLFIS